ncbi:MAG: DUF4474 domain-containing protein [Oscillospiraceae bacterium]|nr:DUF4474 domain-containing protein [Oscillospiraceae bacterium]
MKRTIALALCAILLAGAMAACKKNEDEFVPNVYTTDGGGVPAAVNIPRDWVAFGSIDGDNNVTVKTLTCLRAASGESVWVDPNSRAVANISDLDGTVASITVDGRSISVMIEERPDARVLYAALGDPGTDATTTIDLGDLTTLPTAGAPGQSGTNKPPSTTKPLGTAVQIQTTKKPVTTTDRFQEEKDRIINSDMSSKEKAQALKLLSYMLDENGVFYVEHEPWQKQFGFNQIYDLASPLIQLVYGTIRIKFRYGYVYKLYPADHPQKGQVMYDITGNPIYETGADGKPIPKDWMIQCWKGRYGLVMLGAEFGVYTKPSTQTAEHYYCAVAEEELVMAMDVYQQNFKTGTKKHLFTRGPESAWWLTGFVQGTFHEFNRKDEIIAVVNMTFPSEEMMRLFYNGMKAAGFRDGSPGRDSPETITTNGNSCKFCWQFIDQDANISKN